jgi:hypothetical protein
MFLTFKQFLNAVTFGRKRTLLYNILEIFRDYFWLAVRLVHGSLYDIGREDKDLTIKYISIDWKFILIV